MGIWVDTDFGFDDLWALLQLRSYGIAIDGVSLVAGNSTLENVTRNALGAQLAFDLNWPFFRGAASPLKRALQTAERVLGPRGMQTRGEHLPEPPDEKLPPAEPAMLGWLTRSDGPREMLALGPLTNLAHLALNAPEAFARIDRLVWMGGSVGQGNQTPYAEFNAHADAEAIAIVAETGVPFAIVDLVACHEATYGEKDIPSGMPAPLGDLMGGYMDIGLRRGRDWMPIYDPLAALAFSHPEALVFEPQALSVDISAAETYGQTSFEPVGESHIGLATGVASEAASLCLDALATVTP
jgi:inosine-uridine nucleoside N-ribohydrolase